MFKTLIDYSGKQLSKAILKLSCKNYDRTGVVALKTCEGLYRPIFASCVSRKLSGHARKYKKIWHNCHEQTAKQTVKSTFPMKSSVGSEKGPLRYPFTDHVGSISL